MYLPLVMEPPFQNMVPTAYFIAKRNKLYVSRNKFIDYLFNTFPVHALTKKAVAGKGASLAQWGRSPSEREGLYGNGIPVWFV